MMIKKRLISLLLATTFLLLPKPILAQGDLLESCFKYYQYGEVAVNLNSHKTNYNHGELIKLNGTITNHNSFPILEATVFAHVRRINHQSHEENGHFLIERITLAEGLNFLPFETKQVSLNHTLGIGCPPGQYQFQYYIFSKDDFYYSGRPFLEEDYAGVTNLEFKASKLHTYFDLNSFTLDGQSQKIRDSIPVYESGQNPLIAISLNDAREQKNDLFVNYFWYRWDDSFEKNLIKTGTVEMPANQPPVFQTTFDLPDPGAYVLYLEIGFPTRSAFKFRIARKGEKAYNLRMNDLGITNYPIDPQKDRAFVCFHSPSQEESPQTKVTLSILNKAGQILEEKRVQDSFSGRVMAISLPLAKITDRLNFSVQANFENLENPALSQKLKYDYSCQLFDQSLTDLDLTYANGKIKAKTSNLCGTNATGSFAEKIIISQNGTIKKEEYNIQPIPLSINTNDLPEGKYNILVKSGAIEKQTTFTVGKKARSLNTGLLIVVLTVFVLGSVIVIFIWKRKRPQSP